MKERKSGSERRREVDKKKKQEKQEKQKSPSQYCIGGAAPLKRLIHANRHSLVLAWRIMCG